MEYKVGQELVFRKDIAILCWVDTILPAGSMGLKENYLRVSVNDFSMDIPQKLAINLFEANTKKDIEVVPEPIPEPVVPKKRRGRKKKDA